MKKLIFILFIILLGCESETDVQNTDFEIGVISGEISFIDLLTNQEVSDNELVSLELRSIGNNPASIREGVNTELTGSTYEFGPLNFGEYEISAEFMDEANGVTYSEIDSVEVSSETPIQSLDITLIPRNQTIILGELLNGSDMPVSNAEVFLYNDSIALQQFRGLGGFIDSGISNQLGRAVFSGHVEGDYYLLGRLIIETDTLFSRTEELIPTNVINNQITTVNSIIEFN